jgi:hypothetical protein
MWTKKNGFRSSLPPGILQPEMFAMKSMDKTSALLKLKLDLVYRDLAIEAAQTRFDELNVVEVAPEAAAPAMAVVDIPKAPPKKKVIKALVPAGAAPAKRVVSDAVRAAASERMKKFHADKKAEVEAHRAAMAPRAVLPAAK